MRQLLARVKAYITRRKLIRDAKKPSKLPVGLTEFNEFCDDVIAISGEFADRDSMVYAIASNIIHIKHDCDAVPKAYFAQCLRKAAANQVASAIFTEIKERHEKQKAEDTAAQQPAGSSAEPMKPASGQEKL